MQKPCFEWNHPLIYCINGVKMALSLTMWMQFRVLALIHFSIMRGNWSCPDPCDQHNTIPKWAKTTLQKSLAMASGTNPRKAVVLLLRLVLAQVWVATNAACTRLDPWAASNACSIKACSCALTASPLKIHSRLASNLSRHQTSPMYDLRRFSLGHYSYYITLTIRIWDF